MDSLGKLADIFLLIVVLFVFPVTWTVNRSELIAEEKIPEYMDSFICDSEKTKFITKERYENLIGVLDIYMKHYNIKFSVKRGVAESYMNEGEKSLIEYEREIGMDEILKDMDDGGFRLYQGDMLEVHVFDRDGPVISKVKSIT